MKPVDALQELRSIRFSDIAMQMSIPMRVHVSGDTV